VKLTTEELRRIIAEEYQELLAETEDTYDLGDDPKFRFDPDADAEISTSSRHDEFSELRKLFHEYFRDSQEDRIDQNAPSYSKLTRALLIKNLTCALQFTDEKFENAWGLYEKALSGPLTTEVYSHDHFGDLPSGTLGGMTINEPKIHAARNAAKVGGEEYDEFFTYMYEYGLSLDDDAPCGGRGILYTMRFIEEARKKGFGPEAYASFERYWKGLEDFQKVVFVTTDHEPIPDDKQPPEKSIVCPDYKVNSNVDSKLIYLRRLFSKDPSVPPINCDDMFKRGRLGTGAEKIGENNERRNKKRIILRQQRKRHS
tara:strand:+ start:946 stop:1887 length:942 start_codon:yes stop_codon:yes gene_type:complete